MEGGRAAAGQVRGPGGNSFSVTPGEAGGPGQSDGAIGRWGR